MMKFQDLASGFAMYFDPLHIVGVVPAFAPPPAGVTPGNWIPKRIGSQLMLAGCAPVAVRGDVDDLAAEVGLDQARARIAHTLN